MSNERPIYKLIDLFAGAGGLSNGFTQTGYFEIAGAVEINKAAIATYIENHKRHDDIIIKPNNSDCSDITKIDFEKYIKDKNINGDETVVIGGPPCQGFSNANRQKNYLISGNNQLVKEFARAIDEIRPTAFLMENVKAMSSVKHKFFVTRNSDDKRFKYSSERHLVEIGKYSLDTDVNLFEESHLWRDDEIRLIQTEDAELIPIIREISERNFSTPIIENEKFISRIRSLERKVKKHKAYQLKSSTEKKECAEMVCFLRECVNETVNGVFGVDTIVKDAANILEDISKRAIDLHEFQTCVGRLKELNMFLMHLKEIEDEQIKLTGKLKIKSTNDKLIVDAPVLSYNIVDYLLAFFKSLNYEVDSSVLNAADYGVPQNRHRFMILGIKRDKLKLDKVELPASWLTNHFTTEDAIKDLEEIQPDHDVKAKPLKYTFEDEGSNLQKYYRSNSKDGLVFNHVNTKSESLSIERFEHIKNQNGKNFHSLPDELKDNTYANSARTQNTIYLRLDYFSPSQTVVNIRKSMWNHPEHSRALSIREAARLQSFKDNFIFKGTKDQQYQQVGNAVPPLLARAVAEQMLKLLGEKPKRLIMNELQK